MNCSAIVPVRISLNNRKGRLCMWTNCFSWLVSWKQRNSDGDPHTLLFGSGSWIRIELDPDPHHCKENLFQLVFYRPTMQGFVSFRRFRMLKASFANKEKFSWNTKFVSLNILENFVRKKLECQPYIVTGALWVTPWSGEGDVRQKFDFAQCYPPWSRILRNLNLHIFLKTNFIEKPF